MIDLRTIQTEIGTWAERNFGTRLRDMGKLGASERRPSWHPLLGVGEEVGELNHAHLKRAQAIRGSEAEHIEAAKDAVGDIMIYLMDYCELEGYDLEEITKETWGKVSQRDWRANSQHGNDVDR